MHGLKHIIVALVVVSAFAITGCSDVEMTADKSPGSETPENYDIDIKGPTNGIIFDNLYIYGDTSHRSTVSFKIRNSSKLNFTSIREIRYGGDDVIPPSRRTQTYDYTGGIELTAPYKDGIIPCCTFKISSPDGTGRPETDHLSAVLTQ